MPSKSPLTVDSARRILDYDRDVFARFAKQVRRLPGNAAFEEREIGHHTLFGTLVHILHVREAWFQFVVLDAGRDEETFFGRSERNPANWAEFDRFAAGVWASQATFRAALTERRLAGRAKAWWMKGEYTVGDAVLQASYEEAHHLGEIIGALWQKDIPTSKMTWIEATRPAPRRRG